MKKLKWSVLLISILILALFATGTCAEGIDAIAQAIVRSTPESAVAVKEPGLLGEIKTKRSQFEKHFLYEDGTTKAILYPIPVHYETEAGTWADIDNTLEQVSVNGQTEYRNKAGSYKALFKASLGSDFLSVSKDGADFSIGLDVSSATASITQPEATDNPFLPTGLFSTVLYANVQPGVDLQYTLTPTGVTETVIIRSRKSSFSMDLAVAYSGDISLQNGELTFTENESKTEEENTSFEAKAPVVSDAEQAVTGDVAESSLATKNGEQVVNLSLDDEYLQDSETEYPVSVTRTYVIQGTANIDDAHVNSMNTSTNYGTSVMLQNSKNGLVTNNVYIKINGSILTASDYITSAKYSMVVLQACNTKENVYNVTSSWTETGITYASQPTVDTTTVRESFTPSATGRFSIDVTSFIDAWRHGSNYGFAIIQPSQSASGADMINYASSENTTSTNLPYLELTYKSRSPLSSGDYISQNLGNAGTAYVNKMTGQLVYQPQALSIGGNRMPVNTAPYFYNGWHYTPVGAATASTLSDGTKCITYTDEALSVYYFLEEEADSNSYTCEDYPNATMYINYLDSAPDQIILQTDDFKAIFPSSLGGPCSEIQDMHGDNKITATDVTGTTGSLTDGSGRIYNATMYYLVYPTSTDAYIRVYDTDGTTVVKELYVTNGTDDILTYKTRQSGSLVTDYAVTVTYNSGKIASITSGTYRVTYAYESTSGQLPPRVIGVTEYAYTGGSWIQGDSLTLAYSQNKTVLTDREGRSVTEQYNLDGSLEQAYDASGNQVTYGGTDKASYADKQNRFLDAYQVQTELPNLFLDFKNNTSAPAYLSAAAEGGAAATVTYNSSSPLYEDGKSIYINKTAAAGRYRVTRTVSKGSSAVINYTFRAYVRLSTFTTGGTEPGAYLSISAAGTDPALEFKSAILTSSSANWKLLTVTAEIPAGYTSVSFNMVFAGGTGTVRYAYEYAAEDAFLAGTNLVNNADLNATATYGPWTSLIEPAGGSSIDNVTYTGARGSKIDTNVIRMYGNAGNAKKYYQTISLGGSLGDGYQLSGLANALALVPLTESRSFSLVYKFTKDGSAATEEEGKYIAQQDWQRVDFNQYFKGWQALSTYISAPYKYTSLSVGFSFDNQEGTVYFDFLKLIKTYTAPTTEEEEESGVVSDVPPVDLSKTEKDDKGRIIQSTTGSGVSTAYTYDEYGNVLLQSTSDGREGINLHYGYTANGQYLSTLQDALGTIDYNYDTSLGRLTSVTDQAENLLTYTYDAGGRVTNVKSGTSGPEVGYTYTEGRLTGITHNSMSYVIAYNAWGSLQSISVAGQSLLSNTFTTIASGNYLTRTTYGNAQYIDYTYDALGHLTEIKYNGDSAARYKYVYDLNNRLLSLTDNASNIQTVYNYDADGVLQSMEEQGINGNTYSHSYTVSSDKLEESINNTDYVTNFTSDADGKPVGTQYNVTGGYLQHENGYDTLGRLTKTNVLWDQGQSGGNYELSTRYEYLSLPHFEQTPFVSEQRIQGEGYNRIIDYSYDSRGNIVSCDDVQYYYDALNQLTRVNDDRAGIDKTTVYSYDAGGNITAKTEYAYTTSDTLGTPTRTYTYTYNTTWKDKLASFDGKSITYDNAGNPLTFDGWTFGWQGGRQLGTLVKTGANLAFTYNKDGIRTSKTYNSVKTTYSLIGNKITGQTNGTDTMYFRYDSSDNLIGFSLNNVDYIYIKNVQGDIIAITDTSGNVIVEYTYDAWGQVLATTGSAAATVGAKNPFLFKGYYYDIESGLYYLQSRYYNPSWGRFMNADDATYLTFNSLTQLSNIFIYCNNNPIKYHDKTGNWAEAVLQYCYIPSPQEVFTTLCMAFLMAGKPVANSNAIKDLNIIDILARLIYDEASKGSKNDYYKKEQSAVAYVLINRGLKNNLLLTTSTGNAFRQIALAKGQFSTMHGTNTPKFGQSARPDTNSKQWKNAVLLSVYLVSGWFYKIPKYQGITTQVYFNYKSLYYKKLIVVDGKKYFNMSGKYRLVLNECDFDPTNKKSGNIFFNLGDELKN